MNTPPKISIIIANFNNGHFFIDCFNSLINQTEVNWEAIVIDDCSTDNSGEVIKELIKSDKRFKFYQNNNNKGYTKTLLAGISYSSAEIFGRLDPDDALLPNAIEMSLLTHRRNPEVGLVYSNLIVCDQNLEKLSVHTAKQIINLNLDYYNFNGEISHFATIKRKVYNKTIGIDQYLARAQDKDLYMKLCEIGPVKHLDKNLLLYRIHSDGRSTGNNADKAYFWHWVALIKMAERRNINIEDLFVEKLVRREVYEKEKQHNIRFRESLKKSRWLKLGAKLGLFKLYKYL